MVDKHKEDDDLDFGWGLPERRRRIYHVYVAPCFDRKIERERSVYGSKTVDLVLATNEMPKLLHPASSDALIAADGVTPVPEAEAIAAGSHTLFGRRPGRVLDLFGEEVMQIRQEMPLST